MDPYNCPMSFRWRWCLVVVLAAIALSGFMPQAVLTGTHVPSAVTELAEGPPTFPSGCAGTACGRSTPAAPTPVLTIAALLALTGVVAAATGGGLWRRLRSHVHSLPRGVALTLFHPPRFS
jgi:hypothetical protein